MTRDDIIKLATQAGWQMPTEWDATDGFSRRLKRFAALIEQRAAAAEREACAQVCELLAKEFKNTGGRPYDWKSEGAEDCAYEIRAGGEKP